MKGTICDGCKYEEQGGACLNLSPEEDAVTPCEIEMCRREAEYCVLGVGGTCCQCSLVSYGLDCHNQSITQPIRDRLLGF